MQKEIKEAVYVALTGGVFYYAAKYLLKTDAYAALLIGTTIGRIFAIEHKNK